MGTKLQLLDVALTKERLTPASGSAMAQFKKIGLSVTAKVPDLPELEKLMLKTTPPTKVEFLLSFDGKVLLFYAKVGTKTFELARLVLASAGSIGVQRAILEKLKQNSAVVEKGDLDAFNTQHPPPPTAEEQGKLQQELAPLRIQLRDKSAALVKLQGEIKTLQEQMKPLLEKEKKFEALWKAN